MKHFAAYLLPVLFWINTDHKNLMKLLTEPKLHELNPILYRIRIFMGLFRFEIRHVKELDIPLADQLSRDKIKLDKFKLTVLNTVKTIKPYQPPKHDPTKPITASAIDYNSDESIT